MQEIANSFGESVEYQGIVYKRHQPGSVSYPSLCDAVEVSRHTYRLVGERNGPTIVPMELETGLLEGATPALARNVAHSYGENHMRAHLELLEKAYRLPPLRASLKRLAKRLAAEVGKLTARIEPKIRRLERVPEEAHAVVIGVDRTSAPMEEPRTKAGKRGARPITALHPRRLRSTTEWPTPPRSPWWTNVVSLYSPDVTLSKQVTRSKKWWLAPVLTYATTSLSERTCGLPSSRTALAQCGAWCDQNSKDCAKPGRFVVGAKPLTSVTWSSGSATHWNSAATANAAGDCPPGGRTSRNEMSQSTRFSASSAFIALTPRTKGAREKLESHITYIENNLARMRYRTMRRRGLLIGSGITESACKTVVNMRTKGAGQRWHCTGLRGVLKLRAINASDRFDAFWAVFARMHVANVNNCERAA